MVAFETTVYPNFKSKELCEAYKTEGSVEVAKHVLSVGGEYANWFNKAIDFGKEEKNRWFTFANKEEILFS